MNTPKINSNRSHHLKSMREYEKLKLKDLGNTSCAVGVPHAHAHSVTGMTGVHGTAMGTPIHHHQYRPVPTRDFDDCDSEKQTHSITSSEKESKKTAESTSCSRGTHCNWLTFTLCVALILALSAVIALVAEALIHGCFRGGGGAGGGGRSGTQSTKSGGGGGGVIGDLSKMMVERKLMEESVLREKKEYNATDGARFPWQKLRLPRHFIPEHYNLRIHPNLTTFNFSGQVYIKGSMQTNAKFLIFHAKNNLKIAKMDVFSNSKARAVPIALTKYCPELDQWYVLMGRELLNGERVQISIKFSGILEAGLQGFYRSSYQAKDGKHWIATTHFEPTYARMAFPCLDEPDLKANFTLTLIREHHHVALGNMPSARVSPVSGSDNVVSETFQESVKMSTYLVAFIVCDFTNKSTRVNQVQVSVWAPKAQIDQTPFALEVAAQILEFYSDFFRTKYPLPKLDLIAVPDFPAGAMENWGLITYRMSSLLYDPRKSSAKARQWVAEVVAHELAHQWFGNLVTMKWWDDLWLNEGFANFVDRLGIEHIKPKWKFLEQQFATHTLPAMHEDAYIETHPIQVVVKDPKEIAEIFDRVSYDKGSAVLQMLSTFIGAGTMSNGLSDYLHAHKFGNAQTSDLWAALTTATSEYGGKRIDVGGIMDTWTKQSGYPVLTVTKNGNRLTIHQERFLITGNQKLPPSQITGTSEYLWNIPIHYVTSDNGTQVHKALMTEATTTIVMGSNPAWVKLNAEQVGFYRVHYDERGWNHILNVLLTNHERLTSVDRAGVIDDAFSLARCGKLSVEVALDISKYLTYETEYVPWKSGLGGLGYFMHTFEEHKDWPLLRSYLLHQIKHVKNRLGWEKQTNILDLYLRNKVLRLAAFLEDDSAVQRCQRLFGELMRTGRSRIGGNLRAVVYTTAIQFGGKEEFDFVWRQYLTTQVASERTLLLRALAKTTQPDLIRKLLHSCLDEEQIKAQDAWGVINGLAGTTAGKWPTFHFVKVHWNQIVEHYPIGSNSLGRLLKGVTARFVTENELEEARRWYGSLDEKFQQMRAVRFSLERIANDASWLKMNAKIISNWLRVNAMSKT